MPDLYWREPLWLLLLILPLLGWGLWRSARSRLLNRYADPALQPWVQVAGGEDSRWRWSAVFMLLAWALLVVALAGPRQLLPPAAGVDASRTRIVLLDLSRSMEARDALPSRRGAALGFLRSWLDDPWRPRLGLVLFAGSAHLYLPPTTDGALVRTALENLPALRLPVQGNALPGALRLVDSLPRASQSALRLLLVSDGDYPQEVSDSVIALLRGRSGSAPPLDVLMVGTTTPVPLPDGERGWLRGAGGTVLSGAQKSHLVELAREGRGTFRQLSDPRSAATTSSWAPAGREMSAAGEGDLAWRELYAWPAGFALLALCLALLAQAVRIGAGPGSTAALGLVLSLGTTTAAVIADGSASPTGADLLAAGRYPEARDWFRQREGYVARFGEGSACFRLEDFACATESFAAAAWQADSDRARGRAAFNLGHAQFFSGDFQQAVVLYRDALAQGVEQTLVAPHLAHAEAMAAAVRRHLADSAKAMRRADFRARSRQLPEGFADRLAEGIYLAEPLPDLETQAVPLPLETLRELMRRGIARATAGEPVEGTARSWAGGTDVAGSAPASIVWEAIFAREAGLPGRVEQPRTVAGMRPW